MIDLKNIMEPFFLKNTTLVIRGPPGSGKTTLSLEILNIFKDRYKPYYISTRVSLDRLSSHYPWINTMLNEGTIINYENLLDYRAATPEFSLQNILDIIISNKPSFIILDSYDALTKILPLEDRLKIEKTIALVADANGAKVVFVSEGYESSTNIEYLADGIITLTVTNEGYVKRKMVIDKMRGISIDNFTHYFSLKDSHFTLLTLDYINTFKFSPFQNVNDTNGYISSGNKYVDNILGGFKKGSVVLLEIEPTTNRIILKSLLEALVVNALKNGNLAFVVTSAEHTYLTISDFVSQFVNEEDLYRFFVCNLEESEGFNISNLTDDIEYNHLLLYKYYGEIKNKFRSPLVMTYDLGWYDKEIDMKNAIKNVLERLVRDIRKNNDVMVIVNRAHFKSMSLSEMLSDIHLKVFENDNTFFLLFKKPYRGLYSIFLPQNIISYELIEVR